MKADNNEVIILRKFHSKLPISTKGESMTDEFMDRREELLTEFKLEDKNWLKYVIILQYISIKFSIYFRSTIIVRQNTIEILLESMLQF